MSRRLLEQREEFLVSYNRNKQRGKETQDYRNWRTEEGY